MYGGVQTSLKIYSCDMYKDKFKVQTSLRSTRGYGVQTSLRSTRLRYGVQTSLRSTRGYGVQTSLRSTRGL